MFHELFRWLQEDLGKRASDGMSWSQQLHGSLNLWNITEGTHVLTLMVFAGTIWIIDLRMMGLAFRSVPFSKLNDRVLPITIAAFGVMIVTGLIAFFGRDPMMYYHDIWFRLKMIFLILASINIFWFHHKVQKSQVAWDAMPTPPVGVRLSGAISMASWLLIIIFGRFIAYDWYKCDKLAPGSIGYVFAECRSALLYMEGMEEAFPEETVGEEIEPPQAVPDATTADPEAPEAAPVEPTPGNEG